MGMMDDITKNEINVDFDFVDGTFDMEKGELICIPSEKYCRVDLCFKTDSMHVGFAKFKLYSGDRFIRAKKVFPDAVKLGKEICRRWNAHKKG